MSRARRLLSIAHSYVVGLNRRLAHEMAKQGRDEWEVTAVAPSFFRGDFGPIRLEPSPTEPSALEGVAAHMSQSPHLFVYGKRVADLLALRWDMVHCWEEPYVLAGAQVGYWTPRNTRLVYTTCQNIKKNYPPPFKWIERFSMQRACGWTAIGHTVAGALSDRAGYRSKPWRVVPLGVDVGHFRSDPAARERTRLELGWTCEGPPVVGFLGRFVPQKGLRLLTQALDRLESPWRALFVGGGPLEGELRRWAARFAANRVVIATGVRHDDVPRHLNAMDVMCAPSQTTPSWKEQLGRMILEAFACGVPVVASDSGEIPHVVADAGVIVGERDTEGWTRAIEALLGDRFRRSDLADRGLAVARSRYAWPVVAGQALSFFRERLEATA